MASAEASTVRVFGSASFFRLWLAQVVSSLGDWIGFIALTAIAARLGGSSPESAVGVVLSARLIPGFFLGTVAGVVVDRWDRKRVMVICDMGRGLTLATIPFIDTVAGLFLASLMLEVFTLLWSPAKEASVPNLVRQDFLPNANSLSLVAAYGTFPVGSAVFALLAGVARWLGGYDQLGSLELNQETIAIWADVCTFFLSAVIISTVQLPRRERLERRGRIDLGQTFRELREGWSYIGSSPVVRSVMTGLGTGLVGAGMLVPLGPIFANDVLGAGNAGFGLLLTAVGTGMATGIVILSIVQGRLPLERAFVVTVVSCGVCTVAAASMTTLTPALVLVFLLGLFGGGVYVLGFTLLQTQVDDELRGRIFATLYVLVRFCLLAAFAVAPVLSSFLDRVSKAWFDRDIDVVGFVIHLQGVRLTLWLGGTIILVAGLLAGWTLRGGRSRSASVSVLDLAADTTRAEATADADDSGTGETDDDASGVDRAGGASS